MSEERCFCFHETVEAKHNPTTSGQVRSMRIGNSDVFRCVLDGVRFAVGGLPRDIDTRRVRPGATMVATVSAQ